MVLSHPPQCSKDTEYSLYLAPKSIGGLLKNTDGGRHVWNNNPIAR